MISYASISSFLSFTPLFLSFPLSTCPLLFFFPSSTPPLLLPLSFSPPFSTGEFLSLAAMDTFLCSVQPEVNDLFVLSLVLINLLAWMDLFITQVTSCFSIRCSGENEVQVLYSSTILRYLYFTWVFPYPQMRLGAGHCLEHAGALTLHITSFHREHTIIL